MNLIEIFIPIATVGLIALGIYFVYKLLDSIIELFDNKESQSGEDEQKSNKGAVEDGKL